jgi:predicted ATPase
MRPCSSRAVNACNCMPNGSNEAAERVCGADPDTLQSLLDKSLLRRRDSGAAGRYWMLETIRDYASERLEESDDAAAARLRHAEWCCEQAERLVGPPGRWLGEEFGDFRADYDNVRIALAWAWTSGHDELGLRLGATTYRFWMRGQTFGRRLGSRRSPVRHPPLRSTREALPRTRRSSQRGRSSPPAR